MIDLIGVLFLTMCLMSTIGYYLYATNDHPSTHRHPIRGSKVVPLIAGFDANTTTTTAPITEGARLMPLKATLPMKATSGLETYIPVEDALLMSTPRITRSMTLGRRSRPHIELPASSFTYGVYGGLSPYRYSDEFLQSVDPRTRAMAIHQIRIDESNANSVPRLASNMELVPVPDGRLDHHLIGQSIANGTESTILRVKNKLRRVLKYQSNCLDGRGKIHPLLRDFWFQALLVGQNLAAEVYFVSPPVKFEIHPTAKTGFTIDMKTRIQCAANPDTSIRYMVMEEAHMSADDWMHGYFSAGQWTPFRETIKILRSTIVGLERMHDQGIIHGDVHYGNVAFFEREGILVQGFIDFGRAFFFAESAGKPAKKRGDRRFGFHCLHTVYALNGYRPSFRDDVFGAVLMAAFLLNGRKYVEHCTSLESEPAAMLALKAIDFLFNYPGGPDRVGMLNVSQQNKADIKRDLTSILYDARSVDDVDARPPYASIIAAADRILANARE